MLVFLCSVAIGQIAPSEPSPLEPPVTPPTAPTLPIEPTPTNPVPTKPLPMPLELLIVQQEPEIRDGQIIIAQTEQRIMFPLASVIVSREQQRISNGLENTLLQVEKELKNQSQNARFYRIEKNWIAKQRSQWILDIPATRSQLEIALQQKTAVVKAVLRSQPPQRTVQDLFNRGIRYYFGSGDSSFAGSPSYRVQNILAASQQLDGQFIEKNAVFSFNSRIRLSQKAGFVLGNIIRGVRLTKEIGGGICQVSTTVWRAAYQAGLPIVERQQHSYRVAYYDPAGYEATVFAPSKDLKFRNDTAAPLWIQMEMNTQTGKLETHFFGVRSERATTISQPQISNERPALPDRFIPDPEVQLGDVKIVSGAEKGMQTRIDRTVRYQSGRIRKDRTQSRYTPWGAIYAVHPRDPRVKK